MTKQNNMLGILLSFAGYTVWVVNDIFLKLAGADMPPVQILSIYFLANIVLTLFVASIDGDIRQLSSKRPLFHFLRSIFITASTYGAIVGVVHLSLADFYTIVFTSPLILTVLGSVFLKEKVDGKMWLAIIFGFIGVLVAVRFTNLDKISFSFIGVAMTLMTALLTPISMLMVRSASDENNYAITFWPQVVGAIVTIMYAVWLGAIKPNLVGIIFAALAGLMGGLGALLTNASLRIAPVAVVSPYHYTQIIGGAIMGYIIWKDVPGWPVIVGAIMVTLSGLYILRVEGGQRSEKPLLSDHANG